ncbi:MAG: cyclic nucleotide-binding domain-containing protein [Deltaproteobacteria bacterium]|nr:cyclic nucleotide-binding domain-containing protein [Deltaproteobacteria bacterium]
MNESEFMTVNVKDGDHIIDEGTWGYYTYIIKEGKAKVYKETDGKQVMVGTLKAGDIFGEMSFIEGTKRTASVIAEGNTVVERIPRDTFLEALNQLPQDLRSKLTAMVSDLTRITAIYGQLNAKLREVQIMNIQERMDVIASFQEEIEKTPAILRRVISAMVQRLQTAAAGCTHLVNQMDDSIKAVDSLSLSLTKK